ncbi:MAG: sulfatase-like hydrolase/transferase [Planctomycetaceae bacterium]
MRPATCLITCLALLGIGDFSPTADARPNIVLIMADDLGYECIAANGGESYRTPVLDGLAAEGVRFEHCYSQPLCTPTRVKLMTGMSNMRNYVEFGTLETSQVTFANLLRDAGYATAIVGKWQLGRDASLPQHFGFDEHCLWQLLRRPSRYAHPGLEVNGQMIDYGRGKYGPAIVVDYACEFIERNKDKPFLLYYPMMLTHSPFEPTPDSAGWNPQEPGGRNERGDVKNFGDMVTYMDKMVGRIDDQLARSGVRDNTLLLFIGDNGTGRPITSMMNGRAVQGGKGLTTDAGTRVPLIVSWPAKSPRGAVCRDLVDMSDFLPTFCEAAGVEIPSSLTIDGQSFLPQLKGEPGQPREWIHIWYSRSGGPTGAEFTRTQRYKQYRTGEFYDIQEDVLEERPLDVASLSANVSAVRDKPQSALDRYTDARPEKFAHWKRPGD